MDRWDPNSCACSRCRMTLTPIQATNVRGKGGRRLLYCEACLADARQCDECGDWVAVEGWLRSEHFDRTYCSRACFDIGWIGERAEEIELVLGGGA